MSDLILMLLVGVLVLLAYLIGIYRGQLRVVHRALIDKPGTIIIDKIILKAPDGTHLGTYHKVKATVIH